MFSKCFIEVVYQSSINIIINLLKIEGISV